MTIGGNTTGALESIGDTDTFTVTLTAGLNYKFSLAAATGFVNAGNLVENLYGPNNVLIPNSSSQITAGSESSKSISITPTTTGTYTLSIAAINGTGTYTISANTVPTPPSPVYRFFDNTNGTHFFTSSSSERDNIINNQSSRYTEETNGYGAVAAADPNATAVYRFFDTVYGTHFFTASASERDTIEATRPDLTFEPNSTFYEHATQQSGDVAVYRFFDTQYGTHFYTGDASEYAGLTNPGSSTYRANLTNEGVGFYAPAGTFR